MLLKSDDAFTVGVGVYTPGLGAAWKRGTHNIGSDVHPARPYLFCEDLLQDQRPVSRAVRRYGKKHLRTLSRIREQGWLEASGRASFQTIPERDAC